QRQEGLLAEAGQVDVLRRRRVEGCGVRRQVAARQAGDGDVEPVRRQPRRDADAEARPLVLLHSGRDAIPLLGRHVAPGAATRRLGGSARARDGGVVAQAASRTGRHASGTNHSVTATQPPTARIVVGATTDATAPASTYPTGVSPVEPK